VALKFVFAGLLVLAGFFMLRPVKEPTVEKRYGFWRRRFSLKINPQHLKHFFAYTTLAAAVFMALNALLSLSG